MSSWFGAKLCSSPGTHESRDAQRYITWTWGDGSKYSDAQNPRPVIKDCQLGGLHWGNEGQVCTCSCEGHSWTSKDNRGRLKKT